MALGPLFLELSTSDTFGALAPGSLRPCKDEHDHILEPIIPLWDTVN